MFIECLLCATSYFGQEMGQAPAGDLGQGLPRKDLTPGKVSENMTARDPLSWNGTRYFSSLLYP